MFFWLGFVIAALVGLICGLALTLTIAKTIILVVGLIIIGVSGLTLLIWKLSDGGQGIAAGIIMLLMNIAISALVFTFALGFGSFISIVFS